MGEVEVEVENDGDDVGLGGWKAESQNLLCNVRAAEVLIQNVVEEEEIAYSRYVCCHTIHGCCGESQGGQYRTIYAQA